MTVFAINFVFRITKCSASMQMFILIVSNNVFSKNNLIFKPTCFALFLMRSSDIAIQKFDKIPKIHFSKLIANTYVHTYYYNSLEQQHSAFSTFRIFNTPHFQHSALSTLRIFNTPHFQHSAFSILRDSVLRNSGTPHIHANRHVRRCLYSRIPMYVI